MWGAESRKGGRATPCDRPGCGVERGGWDGWDVPGWQLTNPVPSTELYDPYGRPVMIPLGKAFFIEASPNWSGEFGFDPESLALAEDYIAEA